MYLYIVRYAMSQYWLIRSRCVNTPAADFFVGAVRNERSDENENVDFVYKRFKANKHRHSNALIKSFPTPPSSCQTDTALLRSVCLPSNGTAQRGVLSPTPTRVCLRASTVALHRRRLLFTTILQLHGVFPSCSVRTLTQSRNL